MKKKFRELNLDGHKYGWIVKDDDDGNSLRIYKDKKIIYDEVISGDIDITPKIVADIIFTIT